MSSDAKQRMLRRAAQDILPSLTVNLGIGLPTEVLQYVSPHMPVCLHSENGIAGVGPSRSYDEADRNLIDAGGAYVSRVEGTAFFDSAVSFSIVRSGRLDLTMLGAFEVAANGDLANWIIPGKFSPGMGGAIELAQKARQVAVVMMHTDRKGNPKILPQCTLPLTAKGRVNRIYTDMALFDVRDSQLHLVEIAKGVTIGELKVATATDFIIPNRDIPVF